MLQIIPDGVFVVERYKHNISYVNKALVSIIEIPHENDVEALAIKLQKFTLKDNHLI
jgi:PAS domain-containing protein